MPFCLQRCSNQHNKSTMVKKIMKLVTAFTPKKTSLGVSPSYEFLPEIWQRIKEYAVPQYVEPIKIGERFISYYTEIDDGIRYLKHVALCMRVEDRVTSFENQKKWKSPFIKSAKYVSLHLLTPHHHNHSKLVLSRFKDEGGVHPHRFHDLFSIRRSVAGVPNCRKYLRRNEVMWWETDKPHKDEMIAEVPFRKTFDPELSRQFIKTNLKKLHHNMFATTPTGFQLIL